MMCIYTVLDGRLNNLGSSLTSNLFFVYNKAVLLKTQLKQKVFCKLLKYFIYESCGVTNQSASTVCI